MQILEALKIKTSGSDMNLSCAVVRGDIKQGLVNIPKGIAFNADTFYLVANGKINLQNEKINLDLQPFSGKITDVNISSILGNLIKITGTLSNPKIGINQTATAKNVIGAIASGGAYNVGDLMLSADSAPCHTALKGTSYADYFKGDKTIIGYYAQEHEGLNLEKTILENFDDLGKSERELRNLLGRFLFYGDDVFKKVKYLSPGERSRVALARLAMIGANLLILDEPTNHLDPKTQEIIADVFKDYEGTMLVVSHNINFTNNLNIDRMLYMQTGEICYYDKEKVKEIMELNTR